MDAAEVEVLPAFYLLGYALRAENYAPAVWGELAEGFFVAVVWLVLRDEDHVRLGEVV